MSTARKNKKCFLLVYTVCFVRWDTYYLANQVEHQKLNQTTVELPLGWIFGVQVQLGLRQTQALINTNCITLSSSLLHYGEVTRSINQCLCLPKTELNTKNSTKRQLCCRLVEFLVFNSICQIISFPFDEANRVEQYKTFLISPGRRHVPLFKGFSGR